MLARRDQEVCEMPNRTANVADCGEATSCESTGDRRCCTWTYPTRDFCGAHCRTAHQFRMANFPVLMGGVEAELNMIMASGEGMRRRAFITLLGGAAAWPPLARAQQQSAMPVVGFVNAGSPDASLVAGFRKGLDEAGYVESQNVMVEYHWLEGQFDRLPVLMGDLAHRRLAVIATPAGNLAAITAKAATTTIPIVFSVGDDPVKLGLVDSLARPGGNATGINYFNVEVSAKRLGLLHELVPKAVRIAVLVNTANAPTAEITLQNIPEAARALGLQIYIVNASTGREIEAAFAALVREQADALFVAPDIFFVSRRVGTLQA